MHANVSISALRGMKGNGSRVLSSTETFHIFLELEFELAKTFN